MSLHKLHMQLVALGQKLPTTEFPSAKHRPRYNSWVQTWTLPGVATVRAVFESEARPNPQHNSQARAAGV